MRSLFSRITLALLATIACVSTAQATPINYNFSISGFTTPFSNDGAVAPQSTVSGSLTLDGISLQAFNMSIAGHTYSLAEVGVTSDSQPDFVTIGGLLHGADTVWWGTDDFFFTVDLQNGVSDISSLGYSVNNTVEFFQASFGTLTTASVPEPGTLALLGVASLAGVAFRRKK